MGQRQVHRHPRAVDLDTINMTEVDQVFASSPQPSRLFIDGRHASVFALAQQAGAMLFEHDESSDGSLAGLGY